MIGKAQRWLEGIFETANGSAPRPQIDDHRETNIPGLFVIGDLAGASVIKMAMEQGVEVIEHIVRRPDAKAEGDDAYDVIVVGSGAAGLNAALEAQEKGLRCLVLEKNKIANIIEDFPEGKWIYAEPTAAPNKGKLWFEEATKEELVRRWQEAVQNNRLDVRTEDGLQTIVRHADKHFTLKTEKGREYRVRHIVLATGQHGTPRCLEVPGEENGRVFHRLYSPKKYKDESILVAGGGNTAAEAAITLAEQNRVTLSYRGSEFHRLFKDNRRKLEEAVAAGRIQVIYNSSVTEFGETEVELRKERTGINPVPVGARKDVAQGFTPRDSVGPDPGSSETIRIPYDHAFVLIGSEFPAGFLKSLGIRLENEWTGSLGWSFGLSLATFLGLWVYGGQSSAEIIQQIPAWFGGAVAAGSLAALLTSAFRGSRWGLLGAVFFFIYSLFAIKFGRGEEFWPYTGWAYDNFVWFERPLSFWYGAVYTLAMVVFGIQAMKRWGFDRKDSFQIWRFTSLIGFQVVFMFLIPEFLFHWAVKYQWVGERLASDPAFAENAWRSYGIVLAWPLFFYTFLDQPHMIWVVWGALLSFGIIPVLVLFHGKRYCSWICTCDGLAETVGDRWRHLAPKGKASIWWERMNLWMLGVAVVITLVLFGKDVAALFQQPADWGRAVYRVVADTWLVGILPLTLYPFFGGKIWCRYWCPLAKMMELMSKLYLRLNWSRYGIRSNEKCIACGDCTRYCLVGIDVMNFAMREETITNANSSCIGCGICVTVCPMDVLSFGAPESQPQLVQISNAG